MGSQTDLDQGGTFRQWKRVWMGPSVGWVYAPDQNEWDITAAGTTTIYPGTNLVKVNVAGLVTVQLFSSLNPGPPAGARPGDYVVSPLTVIDLGGHATAFPITILPYAGETIAGNASLEISADYGAFTLYPKKTTGGWGLDP